MATKQNRYRKGAKARDYDLFYNEPIKLRQITPQLIRAHAVSDETIRKEYSKMRDIAQKRIQRMAGHPEAEATYEKYKDAFPKTKGLTREQLVHALMNVSDFLVAKRGSLTGIRLVNEETRKTLKERGIEIPKDQLANFGRFMNAMKKALNINRGDYGSDQVADLWTELFEKGKISQSKFEKRIREVMKDIEDEQKKTFKRAQRMEINKIIRENPLSDFFDDIALDPRTVKAQEGRKEEAEARRASRSARQRRTFRRRK